MAALPRSHTSDAIEHLSKGYEHLTQLRALLLSSSPAKTSTAPPAIQLLDKALHCVTATLSELQTSSSSHHASSIENNMNCTEPCKRRRIQRWTIVTSVPHFDGYEWRKYGEKNIHGHKFPRSYYKCTHNKEQGCPARKTIQQKEDDDCNPPKYEVIYSMHHICKIMGTNTHLDKKYSSTPINNISSTTTTSSSYVLPTSNCQTNSPQPLLTLVTEQVCPMESMLLSAEPQIEENGIENFCTKTSPSTDLDFDSEWAKWLLSCTKKF
ncbi:hypothetical protein IEQ34_006233 [Dendrobium chrysotoxum]|uniref:WRKY domain-containing protein n=1 Tax=Dendrobium chrysotoxum TaxID=161865 RepID=A0AAV7HFC3_DENCH|nr:hypothetical protein IEQ34_006233 [Dendrobium chrysotoxum]